jgi:IS66 Orf2 like protein
MTSRRRTVRLPAPSDLHAEPPLGPLLLGAASWASWAGPPPRRPGAMNNARGGSLRIPAPVVAGTRTPSGPRRRVLAADRPTTPGLISPRSWSATANRSATSYCQPICNEPASSGPPTAKPRATNRPFHCHGACNVTPAERRDVPVREPAAQLCKVLVWDGTGVCIFQKRLERGAFAKLWRDDDQVLRLTASEFALFIEGCTMLRKSSSSARPSSKLRRQPDQGHEYG